jgi:putative ABC transport system permease protein
MRTARRLLAGGAAPRPSRVLALILLATCFLAAAAPRVLEVFQTRVLRDTLAAAPTVDRTISVATGWVAAGSGHQPTGAPTAGLLTATTPVLRRAIQPPLASPPGSAWTSVTTGFQSVLNPAATARPGVKDPQLELVYRNPVRSHLRLIAGSLPDRSSARVVAGQRVPVFDVAVAAATAARFRLRPGANIQIGLQPTNKLGRLVLHATGPPSAVLHVVGVVRPADPASAFWAYDTLVAAPVLQDAFSTYPGPFWAGAVLIGPDEIAALPSIFSGQQLSLLWDFPLRMSSLTADQAPQVQGALNAMKASLIASTAGARYPLPLAINGNPQTVLASFPAQEAAADQVLSLTITGLFLISMVLILLASCLVIDRRDAEIAALRARGCSLPGLALRVLADTAPLLTVALAAGIAAAVAISPGASVTASWEMTAALGLVALAGPPLLAVIRHRDAAQSRRAARADVTIPRRSSRRAVAELSAAALAVLVIAALRFRARANGGGVNLLTGTGPQLVALLAALLAIRCYPLPLRLLLRLTTRRRGAAVYLGLARAARSASTALLPALALILAMALAGFGGMIASTVSSARVAGSWRQVGADASVTVADIHPISAAAARELARVAGTRHAVTVSDEAGRLVIGGRVIAATAVDAPPAPYAALSADTPFGSFAPSLLADRSGAKSKSKSGGNGQRESQRRRQSRGQGRAAAIPVLVSPGLASLTGLTGTLQTSVDRPLRVRVAGLLAATPAAPTGAFLVIPAWAANRADGPWPANKALLTGTDLDAAALRAIVRRSIPGGALRLRAAVLKQDAAASPMANAATQIFALCLAAAALLAAASVILGCALSADSRRRLLVTLTTIGVRRRDARVVAVLEALPLLVVAVAGGLLAAVALPVAVGPALNLAVFIGAGPNESVRPALLPLAAAAAGTAALVIVTALGQSAAATRGSITQELRRGAEQ